ncbi:S8 family serine peptidase [Microlunatus flavus]|uniref:Subtilase family protein n=1 Tax=Microlunatus flavus TaxID=1036181 RepID=A0A1H9MD93_9ACTN|nr:S8 family serine peptidase [Microlunatus flavus]SER21103.1 Subtilase family protein [Microlunatus flavus]
MAGLAALAVGVTVVTVPTSTQAAPPPARPAKVDRSLGGGLGQLLAQQQGSTQGRAQRRAAGARADQAGLAIRDADGRVLVDLTPQAGTDRAAFRRAAERAGLDVRATDPDRGTLEGFVALDAVPALKALPGRGSLSAAVRPATRVGSATSQGVALQRVSQVNKRGLDGAGVTIGALSDSYDEATGTADGALLAVHAAQDVASGDLPGPGNPANPTPVAVLEDYRPGATDEGRAMLQIAHDVAPAARLCFATASTGPLGFAQNIRRLADPADACGADVIVDDVTYFDEPMFSDGPISDAIDDVAAAGVHYFTSAGNEGVDQAWASKVKLVSTEKALATSNIKLDGVDPALYSGGFQDLRNGAGVDVAQTVAIGAGGGLLNLQWDDPVDLDGPTLGDPYLTDEGIITAEDPTETFSFTATPDQLGTPVQIRTDGIPSGNTDLVLSVTAPDGTDLGTVDTGSSPEVLGTVLDQAGTYTVTVSGFADETGDFTVDVRPVLAPSAVTTDFNVLLFDADGTFLTEIADDNALTGRPQELANLAGAPEVQLVVARAGTGKPGATRLRTVLYGAVGFAEHSDPLAPATYGHAAARGATGVAAYDPFRPFLPEGFTSPGGSLRVLFDSAGRRLPKSQQTRRTPQVASADGGNTTFFYADSALDPDDQPNFFGTSAAAPHAAGIAALAVQRARSRDRSLSPAKLRSQLEDSTFAHDLDPTLAKGKVDGVTLTAEGAQSGESELLPGSMTDPDFFTLRNGSGKTVRSVTLDGRTASPTAPGEAGSSTSAGIVFDPRPYDPGQPRREVGFPFTVGGTDGGLDASGVSASYSRPNGTGQFGRMTLTFAKGLKKGQTLRFGVDRDLAVSGYGGSNEGNGADELGGGVLLPSGKTRSSGLSLTVRRTSGRSTTGQLRNKLGSGWSPVDGYGLVDAEEAVLGR